MRFIKYLIICFLVVFLISGCVKKGVVPIEELPASVEAPEEEFPEPVKEGVLTIFEVDLTADKIMVPDTILVKKGTMVRWNNKDRNFYHKLIIYPANIERPMPEDVIVQSENIDPWGWWDYVFEESGKYIVKDIYSGTMRGQVTAEVTRGLSEILDEGEVIGTINVK